VGGIYPKFFQTAQANLIDGKVAVFALTGILIFPIGIGIIPLQL
jgi:hypothetical protein